MPVRYLVALLLSLLCVIHSTCLVEDVFSAQEAGEPAHAPWLIHADQLTILEGGKQIDAQGHVTISREETIIKADFVRYDREKGLFVARGNLSVDMGGDILSGREAEIRTQDGTGTVHDGELFVKKDNIHLMATEIVRVAENRYSLQNAVITTCDGDSPAWRFTAKTLRVTVEGYAVAKHTTFEIKSFPVIYAPYVVLPAKTKRQSGFLFPYLSFGRRSGMAFDLPFYWAIDPSSDATFYQNYMAKRGLLEGFEYRYARDRNSKGIALANYLRRDRLEDDDFNQDNILRTNESRWWIRGMADEYLPDDTAVLANIDLVSDRDYLLEFDGGYAGFSATKDMLFKTFGRSLADKTSLTRDSSLQLNKRWTSFYLAGQARYAQQMDRDLQDTTLQTLPAISFQAVQQPLFDTPLFYQGAIDYVHYWRKEGIGAHRVDVFPQVSWPVKLGPYLDLTGLAGVRETIYDVVEYGDGEWTTKRNPTRTLQYFQADLSTQLGRVFKLSSQSVPKVKHTLVPLVSYSYLPTKRQDELPSLDGVDRIPSQNLITYSLTNYLTTKRIKDGGAPDYSDILILRLTQSYNMEEQRRTVSSGENRRPFTPVVLRAELMPANEVYFRYDAEYNTYDAAFEKDEALLRVSDRRGDSLFAEYLYTKGITRQLNLGCSIAITTSVSVDYENRRSLELRKDLETRFALNYKAQCWGVSAQYDKTLDESRYMVLFSLYGFGQVGPVELLGSR